MVSNTWKKYLQLLAISAVLFDWIICKTVLCADDYPKAKEIFWRISAQTVIFDQKRNLYIAEGNVIITGGKTRLESDYAEFSNKTKDAFAQGNVLLISGNDSISCNAMNINLLTEVGEINQGAVYLHENHFYIHGENIRKTGKFTYDARQGAITSCSGDTPDWKISGKQIKVSVEGYGTAKHTVFWTKNVPALYSPFLVFPVKTKRQTGFLTPRVTTSHRKGFEIEQPFFWAISRSSDAAFYVDYMSERGVKSAGEYRYILDEKSQGAVFFDYLEDDKIDDGTKNTEFYSFDSTPQRTNRDRYWFRMKANQNLPNEFTAKLDMDVVSDADYLQAFKDGFTGYNAVDDYFEKAFNRGLDAYDDTTRKSGLNLNKSWSNYTFNVEVLWYDNITARRQNTDDTTLQTLPMIEFDAAKQEFSNSGVYYSLDSEYRSFYRLNTTSTLVNGQRADIFPEVYYPVTFGRYANFEPWIGLRETVWHTSDFTDIHGNSDNFRSRELYTLGAELSSKVIRIFNFDNFIADKVKHEIIPKLEYTFTPYISQDDLPQFDSIDTISEQNIVTWSLTNNFITKHAHYDEKKVKSETYKDVACLKLSQSYDIKKKRDGDSNPFSDILLDAELNPHQYFSLYSDLTWSVYDYHFKTLNLGTTIKDNRGDRIELDYRYATTTSESVYARVDISITDEMRSYYSIEKNLLNKKTIETKAGLSYEKSCWNFDLFFAEQGGESKITFLINLHGIGEFGTK